MTQKSDRFTIHARWDNHGDPVKQRALNKRIEEELKRIRKDFPNCGFRDYYSDRQGNFTMSKLDVLFDQSVYCYPNSGRYDYNDFVSAVRAIDDLLHSLPGSHMAHGTYSTTDQKTPWVQRHESLSLGLVVRRGVSVDQLKEKTLEQINRKAVDSIGPIKQLKIIGEPTEVNKVHASLRVFSRNKKHNFLAMIAQVLHYHRNTRWMIVLKNEDGRTFGFGHAAQARPQITLDTVFNYERPLNVLTLQYVSTTLFGSDLYILPV